MHKANLQKYALNASFFLGIPLLWLGVVSFGFAPAARQDMKFLPVVIRPFSSVDFGVDNSTQRIAPMDKDIIRDAQGDRGQTIPLTESTFSIQENQGGQEDREDGDNPGSEPSPINPPKGPKDNPGNGNGNEDNPGKGNGNEDNPGIGDEKRPKKDKTK